MGFAVAIANAFAVSLQDVLVKKLTGEEKFFLIWVRIAGAVPALAILVTVFSSWSLPPAPFWWLILGVSVPLEILAFWLGYTGLQRAPLSLVAPLHGFTGVFLVPVGYLILGEAPTRTGLLGVLSVLAAAFFLGRGGPAPGFRGAFRNILRERGSWFVLAAAFAVTIPISVAKVAFAYAPPLLTAFYITSALAVVLLPAALGGGARLAVARHGALLAATGAISAASFGLHYTGLSLLPAAYFISTKRLSILFNVFWGKVFFQEEHIGERLLGALLMVAGVVLIALG